MTAMRLLVIVALISGSGCSRPADEVPAPGSSTPALHPVTLPDLSRVDESVQAQARERHASLTQKTDAVTAAPGETAAAYGELGMLLHAAEFFEAAAPYYLNAQTLAPDDRRWPYYLGHLYKSMGKTEEAEAAFRRALDLQPDDLATLIWLGRLYVDAGKADAAEPLFTRALSIPPRSVAALAGLGQVALARREFARAAQHLEEALELDPEAVSLHSPLANAYRALGRTADAEAHLKRWRSRDILVPDPLKERLDLALESGLSYEVRGVRAFEAKDWPAAAGFFRQGLVVTPGNGPLRRSLHHKLGTALYLMGDVKGAVQQFEEVLRLAPREGQDESAAKANYSLGILMASDGRLDQAIRRLTAAVRYNPNYLEAHLALANALRGSRRDETSLDHYAEVLRINPRVAEARFGQAMALVRLRRYRESADVLADAARRHPEHPDFSHALTRLLAAAPDPQVRDGQRAVALAQELMKGQKTTDLGETFAMALAEVGDYERAVTVQREVLAAARRAGFSEVVARMSENLRLYERRQPCRVPWPDDDPVHFPGPPATAGVEGAG